MEVLFPVHPRTRLMEHFGLEARGVRTTTGRLLGFPSESNARLVLTDSGGVQEEACILRVPCVTLRDNTERPETIEVGANVLAGTAPQRILDAAKQMVERERDWINPFGDGHASRRIIDILLEDVKQ